MGCAAGRYPQDVAAPMKGGMVNGDDMLHFSAPTKWVSAANGNVVMMVVKRSLENLLMAMVLSMVLSVHFIFEIYYAAKIGIKYGICKLFHFFAYKSYTTTMADQNLDALDRKMHLVYRAISHDETPAEEVVSLSCEKHLVLR